MLNYIVILYFRSSLIYFSCAYVLGYGKNTNFHEATEFIGGET